MRKIWACVCLCAAFFAEGNNALEDIEFAHHTILDQDSKFHLYWTPEEDKLMMEVKVS